VGLIGILWNTLRINSNQQAANEVDENLRYVLSVLNEKVRGLLLLIVPRVALCFKGSVYQNATTTFSVSNEILYLPRRQ